MQAEWWKKSVVYQIYPRSFCDSNNDGIGDINGITAKLGYLKTLGVDVIWISPVYKSPLRDNGYDISDYMAINPEFGTMEDFDRLLERAHGLGLKIVMDLVVNHSSNQHPWFIESRSSLDNPKRGYYIWHDGINTQSGTKKSPPNNWEAWFGGSAWTLDETTNQYYLNLFSPYQPDFNWENPALREEIYSMMRWWLDKGIDGFRMDVINLISKPQALFAKQDLEDFPDGEMTDWIPNGRRIHEFLKEMRRNVLSKYDIITIGETICVTVDDAVQYANSEGTELNMIFQFEHVDLDIAADPDSGAVYKWNDKKINLKELKEVFSRWQNKLFNCAWNSLYWCNHDQPRIVSRLGDDAHGLREKSAKMLAACLHFMQGTPFIYQGEEIGMTNAPFADISDFRDLESINAYNALVPLCGTVSHSGKVMTDTGASDKNISVTNAGEKRLNKEDMLRYMRLKSRDNSRTPMQWNDKPYAGFSLCEFGSLCESGSQSEPWIMVNPNYREINAEEQMSRPQNEEQTGEECSVFQFYQKLIQLRKTMDIITLGNFELLLPDDPCLFVYTRSFADEKLLITCNFSNEEKTFAIPEIFHGADLLITNEKAASVTGSEVSGAKEMILGAYGASVLVKKYA